MYKMLPFETPTIFEQLPRFIFQMPRVVTDQKNKFENDELFRKLSRETEIRYTGYRDRPLEERQIRFINGCREGHTDVAFVTTGTNFQLVFNPCANFYSSTDFCDFDKEKGKVHIRSSFIMDGVCVRWRGYIDLERLDGTACLEYDEERGRLEDAILKEQIQQYKLRMRDFEEQQRLYKMAQTHGEAQPPPPPHHHHHHHHHHHQQHKKASTTHTSTNIPHDLTKSELRKHHIENILSCGGDTETAMLKKH